MADHEIAIRISEPAQLFDVLDPAPFREKSLSPQAEAYLVDCAGSLSSDHDIEIALTGPQSLKHELPAISDAVRGHFRFLLEQAQRRWRWRARIARHATALGVVILMGAFALRGLVDHSGWPVLEIASEGLLIFGWVALWRPFEHLVFDRVEHRARCRLLRGLAAARLLYRATPDAGPLSE